jgi:chorismate dehydratase
MPIRLGAVSYLNARPLVYRLERKTDRFSIRFDVPARCAELLHANQVDLGLIPSIEYLHRPDYRIVPDISIASDGPVASVTLFSGLPIDRVRSIALDTSSRTSAALLRILCVRWFEIEPIFVNMPPDFRRMLHECDAALVIGDNALFAEMPADLSAVVRRDAPNSGETSPKLREGGKVGTTDEGSADLVVGTTMNSAAVVPAFRPAGEALALEQIDLGEEWSGMTGLPFVYAFWSGRPDVVGPDDIAALQAARDRGVAATATIAQQCFPETPEKAAVAERYLRENVKYALGECEEAGLRRFFELAAEIGLVDRVREPRFYREG